MSWGARGSLWLALVLVTSAHACVKNGGEDVRGLEAARSELIAAIELEPLLGQSSPDLSSIKSKSAPRYLTATGRVQGSADDVVAALPGDLSKAGFRPVPPAQPRPRVVAAVHDDLVAEISVYEELGSLRDEPGMAYVQLQVGPEDPALAWTLVQRG